MAWWLWILFGLALLAAEMMTPGSFFVLFFGVAALLVGTLVSSGAAGSGAVQWLLFSVLSIGSLLLFRRRLLARFTTPATGFGDIDTLRNEVAVPNEDLAPGAIGKAELRGTPWTTLGAGFHILIPFVTALSATEPLDHEGALLRHHDGGPGDHQDDQDGEDDHDDERARHGSLRFCCDDFKELAAACPITGRIRPISRAGASPHPDWLPPARAAPHSARTNSVRPSFPATRQRSEVGKIDLDRTFEERAHINVQVVNELDKASEPWGAKVLRYEIKNITPPEDIIAAMEKQMRAEREKRALILTSEGERDAAVNTAEGQKQQVIKASEAKKQQQINEAEGNAQAILAIARATAEGLRAVAQATQVPGGYEAVQLRVAEQYITRFGDLAKATNTTILPANVADVGSMIALAMSMIARRPAA